MLFQVVYSNFQTPKIWMSSEYKIPRAWVTNIHSLAIQTYWSLGHDDISVLGVQ